MVFHKELAQGKWFELSEAEQLGNIGSEVSRLINWRKKNREEQASNAFYRAMELIDLTKKDPKWKGHRMKEIARAKEFLGHAFFGEPIYDVDLDYLNKYFLWFAALGNSRKIEVNKL